MFWTDLLWDRLRETEVVTKWVSPIGRRSLGSYVAHAWIVGIVGMIARATPGFGAWQMVMAVPAVGAVWMVARALDWFSSNRQATTREAIPLREIASRWLPVPLGGGAAAALLLTVGAVLPMRNAMPSSPSQAIAIPDRTDDDPPLVDPDFASDTPDIAPAFDPPENADIIPA
jgi:hypothetical protein